MLRRFYTCKILAPNLTSQTIMALLSRESLKGRKRFQIRRKMSFPFPHYEVFSNGENFRVGRQSLFFPMILRRTKMFKTGRGKIGFTKADQFFYQSNLNKRAEFFFTRIHKISHDKKGMSISSTKLCLKIVQQTALLPKSMRCKLLQDIYREYFIVFRAS